MSTNTQPAFWQHIPLAKAFLCQDCEEVGDSEQACPACASQSLLPLAVVLNREPKKLISRGFMDDIEAVLYMPASFVCDECGFHLEKRTLIAQTGQVGIKRGGEEPDPCPNDGSAMRRVTWKEAYEDSSDSANELMEALIESVKIQSHYAGLLNDYDGGKRLQFSCPAHWIQRLVETGTIRKR